MNPRIVLKSVQLGFHIHIAIDQASVTVYVITDQQLI
jgi:hypothetical protein